MILPHWIDELSLLLAAAAVLLVLLWALRELSRGE